MTRFPAAAHLVSWAGRWCRSPGSPARGHLRQLKALGLDVTVNPAAA